MSALGLLYTPMRHGGAQGPVYMSNSLTVYHDATFASDMHDSSSVAGVVVFFNGAPVHWRVSRVTYVARSSTDSELWGADDALQYLQSFAEMFTELAAASPIVGSLLDQPFVMHTDNTGLAGILNDVDDKVNRTLRHIRTRIHRLRHAIRQGFARSQWRPARSMITDVLTKCMHTPLFVPFCDTLVRPPCGMSDVLCAHVCTCMDASRG
jgi:hypothetical protein